MKNLVTKIALPGAILAFAMALFGGTAYALQLGKVLLGTIILRRPMIRLID